MKEDDFKSGDRRDGGRPTNGRRDDARDSAPNTPRPRRDDQPGESRTYGADRRADDRPNRSRSDESADRRPRDTDAGARPFNRAGYPDRRNTDTPRPPFNREGGSAQRSDDRRSDDRRQDDRRDTGTPGSPFNRGRDSGDRSPFDRDRNRGSLPGSGSPDKPYRPAPPRGDGNSAPRSQSDRREEYPKPKFGRDNSRWDNRGSSQRPPYDNDRRNDGPRNRTGEPAGPRDRTGEPDDRRNERTTPTERPDREPRDNRPTDRNDQPQRNDRFGEERPRSGDEPRQRSGENRFGQERRYAERPAPNRSSDSREGGPREGGPRDNDRRDAGPRDRTGEPAGPRDERRPSSRDESTRSSAARPTRSYDDARPNDRPRDSDRNDRPRSFDRDRTSGPDDRPRSDDRNTGADRPRPYDRTPPPARPMGDRRNEGRNDRSDDRRSGPRSEDRRVGRYDRPPNYDQNAMRNSLPYKKREELERAEKHDNRNTEPGTIRLNRYIANAGICSRREADELIAQGTVQVNGKVVTEMGHKVQPGDVVKYGNRILNPEKMVYVLLNKPKDYITTTDDPEERRTVMELVADAGPFRIYPVGRLDRNTTGLMLMTNDGELAEKLTHPANEIKKVYQVELDKPITNEHFEAIQTGVELEDGLIKPDAVSIVTPDAQVVGIEIHSGRNRIVRRIFENFGYEVTKLDRTAYAGLTKKELPRGKWRFLEPKEVVRLKYLQ